MIKAFFWAWLVAAILLDAGDIITTYQILNNGGVELNRAASFVFRELGLIPGLVIWSVAKAILIALVGGAFLYLNRDSTWLKHGNFVTTFGVAMMVLLAVFLLAFKAFAFLLNYSALN